MNAYRLLLTLFILGARTATLRAADAPAPDAASRQSLRRAIIDLTETFANRYPGGKLWLAKLDAAEGRLAALRTQGQPEAIEKCLREIETLRREALLANPLVSGRPILYVRRHQYRPDHHGTETMFQAGEINTASFQGGGALKTIEFECLPGGEKQNLRTLVDVPQGVVRDPDVSFDGRRIVVSLRRSREDDYHLYEIAARGGPPRQLTSGTLLADIGPAYLPNDQIIFSSTRDLKYCQCSRNVCPNLFVIGRDGGRPRQIGRNDLPELHASLLPDGRILYDRWEYVDRHFGPSYGLWTMNPDGSHQALYYGSNAWSPGAIFDARVIPGREQVVCIFGACHDRPWGAMAILDHRLGFNGHGPVVRIWPEDAIRLLEGVDNLGFDRGNYWSGWIDRFAQVFPKYEFPYPLANAQGRGGGKYFLVSRSVGRAVLPGGSVSPDPRVGANGEMSAAPIRPTRKGWRFSWWTFSATSSCCTTSRPAVSKRCRWPPVPGRP